jgi:hypothetical protein
MLFWYFCIAANGSDAKSTPSVFISATAFG